MDETYEDGWEEEKEGDTETIQVTDIYVGKEGVAAHCKLSEEQALWYALGDEAAPHITLAIGVGYEARSMGPMVKTSLSIAWKPTHAPQLSVSPCGLRWKIHHKGQNTGICETQDLDRDHGREHTDHPDASDMLTHIPLSLWTTHPHDVGHVPQHQVTSDMEYVPFGGPNTVSSLNKQRE